MDSNKAAKLIRMLSSDREREVLNAARALVRMGIHDVAALIDKHATITKTIIAAARIGRQWYEF